MHNEPERPPDTPIEGAPTWVRIVQAAIVGVIAGLALHALLSVVVLRGEDMGPSGNQPTECRKATPAKDGRAVL